MLPLPPDPCQLLSVPFCAALYRRQQALGFLKRHGAQLCQELPVDAVRKLYEVVSEQAARVAEDGVLGASRIQVGAVQGRG